MAHSHDGMDWDAALRRLRDGDELLAPEITALAAELVLPTDRSVIDVGAGAGGAAAAFARLLPAEGSVVTIVDSAPVLLDAAAEHVRSVSASTEVRAVQADLASEEPEEPAIEPADLVYASYVVHHLPDQLAGLRRLTRWVKPGGRLVLLESGLPQRVLPWDVGVGQPGLEDRLDEFRARRFQRMRAEMSDSVRMPMGWSAALREVGLTGLRSWSFLVDRQPPLSEVALAAVLRRLEWLRESATEFDAPDEDRAAVESLLDPDGEYYAGNRDDVYVLSASTVHVGIRPA